MKKTILAIGSTGLGKTTMANLLCGANVKDSSGVEIGTKEAIVYETNEFLYIDTRGFNDSFGKTDEEIFHDMLRLFQKHGMNNVFNIDTILWFCSESERETSQLQREANFIQCFADECNPIDLWKSVLIIMKSNLPSNKLADGPKSAARNACRDFSVKKTNEFNEDSFFVNHFPCWIYDIELTEKSKRLAKMDSETRSELNFYSQDEIKSKIQHLISNFSPISIHFKQGKCKKCNASGDPRLFISRCHTTLIFKHSVKIEYIHPEQIVNFHSGIRSLVHEPDETSVKKFFENIFSSNSTKLAASKVSNKIAEEIIGSNDPNNRIVEIPETQLQEEFKIAIPEAQPSLKSQLFSYAPRVASKALQLVAPIVSTFAVPRITSGAVTSVAILSAASTSAVLAVGIGGIVYYYEAKNVQCKRCHKLMGEEGCVEKCNNCGEEWEKTGCASGYGCCKQKEEKPGCQAREKCTMCQEIAIRLNSQGCKQYCAKCNEVSNTPGCDSSFNHEVVMMD